jgi:hypothetical protein
MFDGNGSSCPLPDFHAVEKRWEKRRSQLERHDVMVEIPEHSTKEG